MNNVGLSLFDCAYVGGSWLQAGGHLPAAAAQCAGPGQSDCRGKGKKKKKKQLKNECHCVNLFPPCVSYVRWQRWTCTTLQWRWWQPGITSPSWCISWCSPRWCTTGQLHSFTALLEGNFKRVFPKCYSTIKVLLVVANKGRKKNPAVKSLGGVPAVSVFSHNIL